MQADVSHHDAIVTTRVTQAVRGRSEGGRKPCSRQPSQRHASVCCDTQKTFWFRFFTFFFGWLLCEDQMFKYTKGRDFVYSIEPVPGMRGTNSSPINKRRHGYFNPLVHSSNLPPRSSNHRPGVHIHIEYKNVLGRRRGGSPPHHHHERWMIIYGSIENFLPAPMTQHKVQELSSIMCFSCRVARKA